MQRRTPHRRHGRKAYASTATPNGYPHVGHDERKGHRVPATPRAGVNSADHGCSGRLREHRLLGRGARGRPAGPPSTATPPTAATPTRPAPRRCELDVEPLGQGRPRRRGGAGVAAAIWPSTRRPPAGCSLMVWESRQQRAANAGAPGWWQGGGSSSPLFDGFDNLYIGQPGAMLSFPPTQWIRWRQPVIGMPTTPRILAPDHLLVVTHLGQVLVFDAHRGTVIGTPLDLVEGVDPTDSTPRSRRLPAGAARAARSPPHRPSPPRPASWWCRVAAGRPGVGAGRAAVPPRPDPAARPRPGPATRSGRDRWPARCSPPTARRSTSTAATTSCGRINAADGKPKWSMPLKFCRRPRRRCRRTATDHRRRRSRHPAGRDQGRAATTPR